MGRPLLPPLPDRDNRGSDPGLLDVPESPLDHGYDVPPVGGYTHTGSTGETSVTTKFPYQSRRLKMVIVTTTHLRRGTLAPYLKKKKKSVTRTGSHKRS